MVLFCGNVLFMGLEKKRWRYSTRTVRDIRPAEITRPDFWEMLLRMFGPSFGNGVVVVVVVAVVALDGGCGADDDAGSGEDDGGGGGLLFSGTADCWKASWAVRDSSCVSARSSCNWSGCLVNSDDPPTWKR